MSDAVTAPFGRDFATGEVLFREGEQGEQMFVIQAGVVAITKHTADGERPIATLGRGEFLGEMAILNAKPRTATATVLEDARCLVIDKKTLELMIAKNTEIAMRLIKKLAARLDAADTLIQILLNPDPQARVLLGLKRHAEAYGEATADGIRVNLDPAVLALEVGTEPEQVNEVLSRLRRLRIVLDAADAATIVIADVQRLLEFLEFLEMPKKFEAS